MRRDPTPPCDSGRGPFQNGKGRRAAERSTGDGCDFMGNGSCDRGDLSDPVEKKEWIWAVLLAIRKTMRNDSGFPALRAPWENTRIFDRDGRWSPEAPSPDRSS
jgi:hypothetical protein